MDDMRWSMTSANRTCERILRQFLEILDTSMEMATENDLWETVACRSPTMMWPAFSA